MYKREEKEGIEELKEEVRLIRKCLEEVVMILKGRYTEAGGEREYGKGTERSKGRGERNKKIIRKKDLERKGGRKESKGEARERRTIEKEDEKEQEDRQRKGKKTGKENENWSRWEMRIKKEERK